MRNLFLFLSILMVGGIVQGQRQLYGHYQLNKSLVNPAMAGFKGKASVAIGHRNQWQQIEGAPTTTMLFGELGYKRIGLGVNTIVEQIGPYRYLNADLNYNYKIPMQGGALSLGVNVSIPHYQFTNTQLDALIEGDQAFTEVPSRSEIQPNFGVGAYYANQSFSLGVSVPYLIKNLGNDPLVAPQTADNIFVHADGLIPVTPDILLKPAAMARYIPGKLVNGEVHTHVIFKEKYWLGAGYRTDNTWVFSSTVDIAVNKSANKQIVSVGYVIESPSSTVRNANLGMTHEIVLRFSIQDKPEKILSPRFLH